MPQNNLPKPDLRQQPNFNQLELDVLEYWKEAGTHRKQSEANAKGELFTVYDGPPTANANPGIHHMLPTAFKDAAMRYHALRGKRVQRQLGWDTHGLPVEVQVEKAMGLRGKMDVLQLDPTSESRSIEKFNAACKDSVWTAKEAWDTFLHRLGRWSDGEPYITYDPSYVDGVWGVVKQIYDKGLVYKDYKVVPHCPRCGTSLSSAEVAQGYIDVVDTSVFAKFAIEGYEKRFLLAWTTTPWTLPGNVGLAVGESISYSLVSHEGEELVLADALVEQVLGSDAHVIQHFKGSDLVGLKYKPLFAGVMDNQEGRRYEVVAADFVTTTDGTGIVHTACMYGEDDYRLGKELGLTMVHTVDQSGVFMAHTPFAGMTVFEATPNILAALESTGSLLKQQQYEHSYPHCWRCKTPLLYYAKDSWYIAVSTLREKLIAANAVVQWIPDHIREGRFGDFIAEARDWAISRERFWGTPLPIWRSEQGSVLCVGSRAELAALTGSEQLTDPHRPYVDDVVITHNGETYHREPYVLDVWLDSGAMPWASGQAAKGNFPADYIAEAVDQTRGWFYSLLVLGTILEDRSPYKAVTCMGHYLDTEGRKMSKSLGNILKPFEVFDQVGADAGRWYSYTVNAPGESKAIGVDEVRQTARKVFVPLWNMASYLNTHRAGAESVEYTPLATQAVTHALDVWLQSYHADVVTKVTAAYDAFDFTRAGRLMEQYITELSTWYLRRSRKRTDSGFSPVFHAALCELLVMMAPLSPMITESLFLALRDDSQPESVHLCPWPTPSTVDDKVLQSMNAARIAVELGLQARASAGIKLRQPLAAAYLQGMTVSVDLGEQIAEELNVLEIRYEAFESSYTATNGGVSIALDCELTDELRTAGYLRDLSRHLQQMRKQVGLQPGEMARLLVEPSDAPRLEALLAHDPEMLEKISISFDEDSVQPGQELEVPLGADATARVNLLKLTV
jgi:isoleucyl-tRNA synthetase